MTDVAREPGTREPGGLAYVALLATTTIGTLSGNVINAPLHRIRTEFGASDSQAVLAVASFTIAMVIFVPFTGWLCDRFGTVRILGLGLATMVLAQIVAAFSMNLEMLVAMRVLQGVACSTFPPGVQRALVQLFPSKGAAAMAAWASAIGVGQAVGPPVGGLISDLVGWRGVFVFQAALCTVVALVVLLRVPQVPGTRAPINGLGMTILMLAMGSLSLAVTLVGQRADWRVELTVGVLASVLLATYVFLAARHPERLLEPRSLLERRYVRATMSAGSTMLIMGVCLVSMPLYLGETLHLSPGPVGFVMFAMALAMALSGRLIARLGDRYSLRVVIELGLVVLVAAPLVLGWWTGREVSADPGTGEVVTRVVGIIVILVVIGCALNAAQSTAAYSISRSKAAKNSMAFGIHNTSRFMGMATGYAWAALVYPLDNALLLYGGVSMVGFAALMTVVIGGPLRQGQ